MAWDRSRPKMPGFSARRGAAACTEKGDGA